MNLKDIKSQFPIFKSNKNLIYFDTANSAQKPKQVIDALEDFYKNHYANIGRAVYGLAARATADFESTRDLISSPDKVLLNPLLQFKYFFTLLDALAYGINILFIVINTKRHSKG